MRQSTRYFPYHRMLSWVTVLLLRRRIKIAFSSTFYNDNDERHRGESSRVYHLLISFSSSWFLFEIMVRFYFPFKFL